MKNHGTQYSTVKPASMEITETKVFLYKDITEIQSEDGVQYKFVIFEYKKNEYIAEIAQNQSDLEDALVELAEMIGG